MTKRMMGTALATVLLAGCATTGGEDPAMPMANGPALATAYLRTAANANVGTVTATEVTGGGVRVSIDATGMPSGPHGVHVHMTGRCDSPSFETAGGHWNPTNMQHGAQNPAGPHAGDLPNLLIGTDGRGLLAINLPSGTMAGLLEGDGSAFIVHSGPDDMMTDPSGNSGSRIACGVFQAG